MELIHTMHFRLVWLLVLTVMLSACEKFDRSKIAMPKMKFITGENLHSVACLDTNKVWISGNHGTIYFSADGGETWNKQETGVDVLLGDIAFVSKDEGWAVGVAGTVLHTADGGKTWQIQKNSIEKDLSSVFFLDAQHGWAVGEFGTIVHTADGGKTWAPQKEPEDTAYNGVFFVDVNTGWVSGEFGMSLPVESPARRLGYRLLGPAFDYILHLRPAEWPIMAAHTVVGYVLAVGWTGLWRGAELGPLLLGLLAWVVLLNGGTLALNSAFDRDEGDIGYLKAPPPVPNHLALIATLLMAAGQGISWMLPPLFRWAYAACFVLSILYSVPPVRLKAVAGLDWIINMWGFGTLTPLAGLAVTGASPSPVLWLVLLAFCPLFAALYPLTQLYQYDEDRRRGDRTLALVLGMRLSLQVAVGGVLMAFALFGLAGALSGWGISTAALIRWGMLAVAFAAWLRVLLPWLRDYPIRAPEDHQHGMYEALGAWAVTDIAVLAAWSW